VHENKLNLLIGSNELVVPELSCVSLVTSGLVSNASLVAQDFDLGQIMMRMCVVHLTNAKACME